MSTKTTVLHDSRHSEFLRAQRQDPVIHKVFAAGDRVTRCFTCLLPFLQESWEAIGRTHCGQSATVALDNVEPAPAESSPTQAAPETKNTQPETMPLELLPIPITLMEVPITLR